MGKTLSTLLVLISVHLCIAVCAAQRRAPIDYSKFSHATQKHQAACDTCHKAPTKDWMKVSSYPDVPDFPGHDACVSCHRPQFFKGAKPPICSVCHSKTSPRDDVRFAFRNPASKQQFTIEFPHDKHQDVIALLRTTTGTQSKVAFAHPQSQNYNNCTICHAAAQRLAKAAAGGLDRRISADARNVQSKSGGPWVVFQLSLEVATTYRDQLQRMS